MTLMLRDLKKYRADDMNLLKVNIQQIISKTDERI